MFWTTLKIYWGLGLLVIPVHCLYDSFGDINDDIWDLVKSKEDNTIDGLFRVVETTSIGRGGYGHIFQGINLMNNNSVAMKFTNDSSRERAHSDREFEMYWYLEAVDKPGVEKYGITPIFYYIKWTEYMLTVFSLFDYGLNKKSKEIAAEPINTLILFRDFVRQSKYIHSHGVRHDDVKPENIMIRKHRTFLLDFNTSSKLNNTSTGGSIKYLARRAFRERGTRYPVDDWESFLYTICDVNDVKLQWFDDQQFKNCVGPNSIHIAVMESKTNTQLTIDHIKEKIKDAQLQEVFLAFADEAFKPDIFFPNYNNLENLIMTKINKIVGEGKPALFTWLTKEEREEAITDLNANPLVTVYEIPEPQRDVEYNPVAYNYFEKRKKSLPKKVTPPKKDEIEMQKPKPEIKKAATKKTTGKNGFASLFRFGRRSKH